MKTKREYIRKEFNKEGHSKLTIHAPTLEKAVEDKFNHSQCTFEETDGKPYTHIMEFVDDEHYNDLYFI